MLVFDLSSKRGPLVLQTPADRAANSRQHSWKIGICDHSLTSLCFKGYLVPKH
jgi:hypothetical protein